MEPGRLNFQLKRVAVRPKRANLKPEGVDLRLERVVCKRECAI